MVRSIEKFAVVGLGAEYGNFHRVSPGFMEVRLFARNLVGYPLANAAAICANRIFTIVIEGKIIA